MGSLNDIMQEPSSEYSIISKPNGFMNIATIIAVPSMAQKASANDNGFSLIHEGGVPKRPHHSKEAIQVKEQQTSRGKPRSQAYTAAEDLADGIPERPVPNDGRR